MDFAEYKNLYLSEAPEEKKEPVDTDPAHGQVADINDDGVEDFPEGTPTTFVAVFFDDNKRAISGMWRISQGQSAQEVFDQARKTLQQVDPGKVVRLDNFTHYSIFNKEQTKGKVTLIPASNKEQMKKKIIIPKLT